jgi:hypothetical protein
MMIKERYIYLVSSALILVFPLKITETRDLRKVTYIFSGAFLTSILKGCGSQAEMIRIMNRLNRLNERTGSKDP